MTNETILQELKKWEEEVGENDDGIILRTDRDGKVIRKFTSVAEALDDVEACNTRLLRGEAIPGDEGTSLLFRRTKDWVCPVLGADAGAQRLEAPEEEGRTDESVVAAWRNDYLAMKARLEAEKENESE